MSDAFLMTIGLFVFSLMIIGIALTILEFRRLPRWQKPEYQSVAAQAQPRPKQRRQDRDEAP